jgi:hypothetical protein
MYMKKNYWRNPAYILWLIRDKKLTNFEALANYFGWGVMDFHTGTQTLEHILRNLEEQRLLVKDRLDGGNFAINNSILEVFAHLGISLKEAAHRENNSILINPAFDTTEDERYTYDVFVLMPFVETMKPIYEDHITAVTKKLNKIVARADDFNLAQSVIDGIWKAIYQSKIIIADCSLRNPNVFYELGIAHTVGKRVILIANKQDDIPFDIRHIRYIQYDYTPRGMIEFEEKLRQFILENDYYSE